MGESNAAEMVMVRIGFPPEREELLFSHVSAVRIHLVCQQYKCREDNDELKHSPPQPFAPHALRPGVVDLKGWG